MSVKKTVTRAEIEVMMEDLAVLKMVQSTAVAIATVSLNKELEKEYKVIVDSRQLEETPEVLIYRKEVGELYNNSVYKGEDGKPLLDNDGAHRLKDREKFQMDTMEIVNKHPEVKKQIAEKEQSYAVFLGEKITIEYDDLSKDSLSRELNYEELMVIGKFWSSVLPIKLKL